MPQKYIFINSFQNEMSIPVLTFPYYKKWEKRTIMFIILTQDLSQMGKMYAKPPESTKLDY